MQPWSIQQTWGKSYNTILDYCIRFWQPCNYGYSIIIDPGASITIVLSMATELSIISNWYWNVKMKFIERCMVGQRNNINDIQRIWYWVIISNSCDLQIHKFLICHRYKPSSVYLLIICRHSRFKIQTHLFIEITLFQPGLIHWHWYWTNV